MAVISKEVWEALNMVEPYLGMGLPYKTELYEEFLRVPQMLPQKRNKTSLAQEMWERQFQESIRQTNAQILREARASKPPAPLVSAGTIADKLAGHVPLPQSKPKPAPVAPKAFPARALTKGWTPIA